MVCTLCYEKIKSKVNKLNPSLIKSRGFAYNRVSCVERVARVSRVSGVTRVA